jgi:hypothetical protein
MSKILFLLTFAAFSLSAQDSLSLVDEAKRMYTRVADNILRSAEAMPDADYAFSPTAESPNFSHLVDEAVSSQAEACSAVAGQQIQPRGDHAVSKTELIAALRQSINTCSTAYASVNSFNASQELGFAASRHTKLGLLFLNASHSDEIYGHMVVYLRLKGIFPPSERARLLPVS